ncbi:MAG: hypothetical protein GW839_03240 [Flavobacteriales bacterium]|nr:hypothetical protein [Flavobacteriia bacterium]NCP06920.1 hypothetical protein [Flavobacteriales bacterium]PIV94125.1 MAG: hypothetical protein COW44_06110 [Flavobacteriaceae bacterium CG17_big_fil_post_rev_8_21_14_2_50_33_15]PIY10989.1 MAG: hypothetical protein COZ17_08130 [Flavobacteriaceae bacterium CG_4_10_14_3_um_filter_33_47]PJB17301.1 MAG: hypothetical protein CO117_12420 [Flavobacteriaceae bacterium CG_4_9_14_3_um_filter_33_16]
MLPNIPSHLSDLPIYKKAMEIYILTRSISSYIQYDLSGLKPDGSEHSEIYFSGDIIQHSVSLAPEILNAELERYSEKKHKHIATLQRLTNLLYKNSYRLEHSNSNGKDFLPILRSELNKFKRLQRNWMLTL